MKELYVKYAYHIDSLREDKGMKISELCNGVCDRRTYSMYINGERTMSQKMLKMVQS